ncbi:MAG TPA: vWA domain-containing protein [Pirellula sp.]|nr:vWA domain-containing protein [Pirellula sp.]
MNSKFRHLTCFVVLASFAWTAKAAASDSVVIVLDDSGSMNEKMSGGVKRIDAAKKAIDAVLKQFPPNTRLGLLLLNGEKSKKHWAIPLEHLSVPQATRRVDSVMADGGTPLGDRIREGADALLQLRGKQSYGNYRLLIVTDGEASDAQLLAQYLPDVLSRGIIVDAIGVDMKQNHSLATRVHSYRRADDGAALSQAIQEVFAEKVDSNIANSQADFALLQALDDGTAKEALITLSKPNNSPIVGISAPVHANDSSVGNPPGKGTPVIRTTILGTIAATIVTCMVPLAIIVIALFVFISKPTEGKKQNRSRR